MTHTKESGIAGQTPDDYELQAVRNGEMYLVMRVLCRQDGHPTLWEAVDGIPCTREEGTSLIRAFRERQPGREKKERTWKLRRD